MAEAAVVEHDPAPSREIEVRPAAALALVPDTSAQDLVKRLSVIRDAMEAAMVDGVDYGKVPGVNKPTLLKPGAEKLGVLFQFDVQIVNEKEWHPDGHLTVVSHATVYHAPTGTRVASGEGICTTRETKYAYRDSSRVCPSCGQPAIIKGRAEYGGGWVCFKKKGGCGAKYDDADTQITSQPQGRVPNDALADVYNTVDKMASKRARIDAILAATGASALFTQDAEDLPAQPATPEPESADDVERRRLLVQEFNAGILRLEGTPGWSLADAFTGAAQSFKKPVGSVDDLTDDELRQIIAAMPDDGVPF